MWWWEEQNRILWPLMCFVCLMCFECLMCFVCLMCSMCFLLVRHCGEKILLSSEHVFHFFFWCEIAVKNTSLFLPHFFWFDTGVKNSSFIWTTFTERVCHFFFWCKIVVKILLSFERFYHPLMWRLATWPIALEHGAADKATKNFFYEETVPIDSLIKIHILLQNVEL